MWLGISFSAKPKKTLQAKGLRRLSQSRKDAEASQRIIKFIFFNVA
jgi:hypothetical protein